MSTAQSQREVAATGPRDAGVVDVHAHGIPKKLLDDIRVGKVRSPGVSVSSAPGGAALMFNGKPGMLPIANDLLDFDDRLAWLDDRAIGSQLVSPWLDVQGHTLNAREGERWTMLLNEYLADQVRDSGGRLHALASVHLADPSGAAAEMERAVKDLGLCGVVLSTDPVPAELTSSAVDEVWATAADLGVPVVLHPDVCGPSSCMYAPNDIGHINAFARVIDSTLLAVRLVQRGVLDRHPGLTLVLVHGGGFLPYQAARISRALEIQSLGANGAEHADLLSYLRRFYYDTVLMGRTAVELLVEEFGAEHVVLGSDYPFAIGDPDPVGTVTRTRIPDQDKTKILGENAQTLFGPRVARVS